MFTSRKIAALVMGLAVTALPSLSNAAMIKPVAPPKPAFAGPYVGLDIGFAWGDSDFHTYPNCPSDIGSVFCSADPAASSINGPAVEANGSGSMSPDGVTGGIRAGYNWQSNDVVFGAEADFGFFDLDDTHTVTGNFPSTFLGTQYTLEDTVSADWLATIRARLGWVIQQQFMLYATGGAAFTDIEVNSIYADNAIDGTFPGGTGFGSASDTKGGWTVGGGGEWKVSDSVSVKLEYLYVDFNNVSVAVPLSNTIDYQQSMTFVADLSANIVRFGVSYWID